jgi:peptidoglycan/LPS O-acetylase OafA/YrhL
MYFYGFTGLRFLAATLVILSHAAISMDNLGVTYYDFQFLHRGKSAVEFFFVLSGFLITYLLVAEYRESDTISIKQFYFRRIKRIWPIYFIVVLIAFFFLGWMMPYFFNVNYFNFPNISWGILLYLFFVPNVAAVSYQVGFLYPLWSIGIEEQFYLFWAPFFQVFKKSIFPATLLLLVIYYFVDFVVVEHFSQHYFLNIWSTMKFDCMLIGALGAILYEKGIKFKSIKLLQLLSIIGLLELSIGLFERSNLRPFWVDLFSSLSYIFLLISIQNKKVLLRQIFESNWIKQLGMISYGMYVYHMMWDWLLRFGIIKFDLVKEIGLTSYFFILFSLTLIAAKISWRYIEKPIIDIKINKLSAVR